MFNKAENVLALIQPYDRVLDIGGAFEVFPRANAVIDIVSYEERRPGQIVDMPEHFSKDDWYIGDICTPVVWQNFKDKEFDFVICSHVLEDIRDPVFVCAQMIRVGKQGYIEFPSRFRECGKAGPNEIAGWDHHRWIIDVNDGTLVFTAKMPWAQMFDFLGDVRREHLYNYFSQFTAIHWVGSFDYTERMPKGTVIESENLYYFYDHYPYDAPNPFHQITHVIHKGRTFEWPTDYRLPIEIEFTREQIVDRHDRRMDDVVPHSKIAHKIPGLFVFFLVVGAGWFLFNRLATVK